MKPFDLGRQCRVVLVGPDGNVIQLDTVTGFEAKQNIKKVTMEPLNGPMQTQHIPNGWEGHFELSRQGPGADDLFTGLENRFWGGEPINYAKVFQYITERNGSESAYMYDNVSISLGEAGSFKATDDVKQKIDFSSSGRTKLG